jgi:hypothetical protein
MMQFDIYREELPNMGYTHILVAWTGATPDPEWGQKLDTVSAQTARDAAGIYFQRAHLVFPMGGMSTIGTGVYCVSIKHK